jgi:ABC-type multidrug transport system fused ATPase/permease subunit
LTVIMIAHRLSTLVDCDYIYRLGEGRIIDEGTFAEVTGKLAGPDATSMNDG